MATVRAAYEVTDLTLLSWMERQARLKRDRKTLHNTRNTFRNAQAFLDEQGVSAAEAEPWMWDDWFADPRWAASTRRKHLADVRAAYGYAVRRGLLERDPTYDIQIERERDEEPEIIPNHELREMKRQARYWRESLLFHFLAYTGMRRNEIRNLRWENVNLATNTITVVGKGGKLRHIPTHPALGETMLDYRRESVGYVFRSIYDRPNHPIGEDTFSALVREFAGPRLPHAFRRTVASSLILNGASELLVDKILGWAPRTVGRRYYINLAPAELQRAILKLYADDPV